MDCNDEKEIRCSPLDFCEEDVDVESLTELRDADQKAGDIAKNIIQLKENLYALQNTQEINDTTEKETCDLKLQLTKMVEKHRNAVDKVLKLAKIINYDVDNLECRKIDIHQRSKNDIRKCAGTSAVIDDGDVAPVIIINNDTRGEPKIFFYGQNNVGNNCYESDSKSIFSSCTDESELNDCINCKHCNNNDDDNKNNNANCCCSKSSTSPTLIIEDYEKNAIRDNLMLMKGEMKLLNRQNRDLLDRLESANQQTVVKSSSFRDKPHLKCSNQYNTRLSKNVEQESENTQALVAEINRLRNELLEVKRDQYQIELAKKILNVSDSQCANCVGSIKKSESEDLTEKYQQLLMDHDAKLLEIRDLKNVLKKTKNSLMNCEDSLMLPKTQVAQLGKKLLNLNSDNVHDSEIISSNDKYLIENLRFRLQKANDEKTSMKMEFDLHTSELKDKKSKYMELLQINEQLKNSIESLSKEKKMISKEYEVEFARMNENLKLRMNEIETLPDVLATTQRELEKEKSMRIRLEKERDNLANDINILKKSLAYEENKNDLRRVNNLEKQNKQLRAKIMALDNSLAENKRQYTERYHYSLQLKEHLDVVRQESAIQVTKTNDFAECQKKKYTEYIQKLEQKLAECRALACFEFKKRDHIDERLRNQIEVLTKNLNEAEKKVAELLNVQKLMESKMGEELCVVPLTFKPSCKTLDFSKQPAKPNDN